MKSQFKLIPAIVTLLVITMGSQGNTQVSALPPKKIKTSAIQANNDTLYGTYFLPEVTVTASAIEKNSECVIKSKKGGMNKLPKVDQINLLKELMKFQLVNIVEPIVEPSTIDSCYLK